MGFNSVDDWVNEVTNEGKAQRLDWFKGTTGLGVTVAGRWYDLTSFPGYPADWIHGNYITNWAFGAGTTGWVLGSANWAYTPATALVTRTANADLSTLSQNTQCENGVTYRVTYTMTRSAGTLTPSLGGTALTARSVGGTFIQDVVCGATANAPLVFTPDATFAGTVDSVIIQRRRTFTPYSSDSTWNVGKDINAYTGGSVAPDTKHISAAGVWGNAAVLAPSVLMVVDMLGSYPNVATDSAASQALTNGTDFVANGTFTGSAASWTLGAAWAYGANTVAKNADGTNTLAQTTAIAPRAGLTYLVTYTISGWTVGDITVGFGGGTATTRTLTGNGTFTDVVTATADTGDLIFTPTNAARFTIDSVSATYGIPRYGDGAGVQAMYVLQNLNGANAANFVMSYTNPAGTSGRSLAATVANTASAIIGHLPHSGVAAGNTGPFLPLGGGDTGVQSIQSCQFSAAQATADGAVNLVLYRPLLTIPMTTGFTAAERDLMHQLPSMPQIKDGACLGFFLFAGAVVAAGNNVQGYLETSWG